MARGGGPESAGCRDIAGCIGMSGTGVLLLSRLLNPFFGLLKIDRFRKVHQGVPGDHAEPASIWPVLLAQISNLVERRCGGRDRRWRLFDGYRRITFTRFLLDDMQQ